MTITDAHDYILDILTKSQSGYVPRERIDRMIERAQMSEFSTKKAAFVETGFIHHSLSPFESEFTFTSSTGGVITCPADYLYPTGSYSISWDNGTQQVAYGNLPILLKDEIGSRLTSQLLPIDRNNAALYISGKKLIQALPKGTFRGTIHYLRKPLTPKFNYTVAGRKQVYNATGSVDLEWEDDYVNVILDKALELLGVNLKDVGISQWAGQKAVNNLTPDKA